MSGIVVYAVATGKQRPLRGSMEVGSLTVVAAPMASPPSPSVAAMRAHDRAVRRASKSYASVIPFRFGAWFESESSMADSVLAMQRRLKDALKLVRDREQMTCRLFDARTRTAPPARRSSRSGASTGTTYLLERAQALREPEALDVLRRALKSIVRSERVELHGTGTLLATVFHLVDRGASRDYARALRRVALAIAPLTLLASGPWAPYAFTEAS
jgi:hypothetical protein